VAEFIEEFRHPPGLVEVVMRKVSESARRGVCAAALVLAAWSSQARAEAVAAPVSEASVTVPGPVSLPAAPSFRLRCATCDAGSGETAAAAVPTSSGALDGLVLGGFAEASVLGILSALWGGFGLLVGSPILFQVGFAALVVSAAQFTATFAVSLFDAARGVVPGSWGDEGRRRLQSMWPLALAFPGLAHLLSGRTAHGLWVLDLFGGGLLLAALSPVLLAAGAGVVGIVVLLGLGLSAAVWIASFLDAATAGGILGFLPNYEDARTKAGAGLVLPGAPVGFARVDAEAHRTARPATAW